MWILSRYHVFLSYANPPMEVRRWVDTLALLLHPAQISNSPVGARLPLLQPSASFVPAAIQARGSGGELMAPGTNFFRAV